MVILRDFLRAQMLFHRHREIGAALHRRVVGDDDAFAARDPADPGDDSPPAPRRRTFHRRRMPKVRGNRDPGSMGCGCTSRGSNLPRPWCRSRAAASPPSAIPRRLVAQIRDHSPASPDRWRGTHRSGGVECGRDERASPAASAARSSPPQGMAIRFPRFAGLGLRFPSNSPN